MSLVIEKVETPLSVCKVADYSMVDVEREFVFTGRTDKERSLVCPTSDVPANVTEREDGWRAFRVRGSLDFSLIGILASIAGRLADAGISIYALSTFDTDYVLVKAEKFDCALGTLADAGYRIA